MSKPSYSVYVLTISDTASKDTSLDRSGPVITNILGTYAQASFQTQSGVLPDDKSKIQEKINEISDTSDVDWIITSGGTGFGTRDITPEAITPLITRPAPGLVHVLLSASLKHTPMAALSRPVAGTIRSGDRELLVVTLPGSPKAVKENLSALLDGGLVLHALDLMKGGKGEGVHREMGVKPTRETKSGAVQVDSHSHHHHHHHHHGHGHQAPTPKSADPALGATGRHRKSPYPLIPVDKALGIVEQETELLGVEIRKVDSSLRGYILAEDVFSPQDVPLLPTTLVDGYAIKSEYTPGTYKVLTPRTYTLSSSSEPIPTGSIYRINTGSPLPPGTDAVVMVEDTLLASTTKTIDEDEEDEEETVTLLVGAKKGEHIRVAGSDVQQGERVFTSGTVIRGGGEIGTLAFVGRRGVKVYRKPVVALLSTGNEITDLQTGTSNANASLGGEFEAGRDGWTGIYDTNRPSLKTVLEALGYNVVDLGIVGDDLQSHTTTLSTALSNPEIDIVLTTGGSSMGSSDLLKPVIERKLGGTIHFGRVIAKPGKPTIFASVESGTKKRKPMFALPGNPASALAMFYVFVVPALRKMGGWPKAERGLPRIRVKIAESLPLDSRPEFHRVHVRPAPDGEIGLWAYSTGGQRSSRVASHAGANGLLALPPREEGFTQVDGGSLQECILFGEVQVV